MITEKVSVSILVPFPLCIGFLEGNLALVFLTTRGLLRQQLWHLQHNFQLELGYKKVVKTNAPVRLDAEVGFKLHSLGLVKLSGNDCLPRCDLYRYYFRERLG